MKIKIFAIISLIFCSLLSVAQNRYILDLKAQKWEFKPTVFYIDKIIDNRQDKKNAGEALSDGKIVPIFFPQSMEEDLMKFLDNSLEKDSTAIPLTLSVEKFYLKETGTLSDHKASFSFQVKIYKEKGEQRFQLYESSGNPYFTMRGPFPNPHEKNVVSALKSTLNLFNDWINKNSDIPYLVNSVKVTFDSELKYSNYEKGDTISWKEDYKLNWNDFKGSARNSSYMAESNCIFTYRAEPEIKDRVLNLHVRLNACFDRLSSWVRLGQEKPALLEHEQLHFDICELYIRLLKKKISEATLDPLTFDTQIQPIFNQVWSDYQAEQQKYDDETEHGIVKDKQQWWVESVREKLRRM